MKPTAFFFTALLMNAPLSAYADAVDVSDCISIANETQRLACYDDLVQRAAHVDINPKRPEQTGATSDPRAEANSIEEFGAENVATPPVEYIEANLIGDFTGWSGKTTFALDNGQVWQQTNNYIHDYSPRSPTPQPKITISKGMFGSYNMRIEGVKRIVQVKRVK